MRSVQVVGRPAGACAAAVLRCVFCWLIEACDAGHAQRPQQLRALTPDLLSVLYLQTQDLLRMERILLDSLAWRVKTPTAYTFLHLYTQSTAAMRAAGGVQACQTSQGSPAPPCATSERTSDPLSGEVVAKAAYLIELALLDYGMLDYRPSEVAASALLLSESWSPQGAALDEIHVISGAHHPNLCARAVHGLLLVQQHVFQRSTAS